MREGLPKYLYVWVEGAEKDKTKVENFISFRREWSYNRNYESLMSKMQRQD